MAGSETDSQFFTVVLGEDGQPVLDAIEQAMASRATPLAALPALTNVALADPYFAQQLADLHRSWEVRPDAAPGLLSRLRRRLGWWLLGSELQRINMVHATLVRLIDSLVVQLDQDRAALRRIEEYLAYQRDQL
jgi:hypothetical protein